RLRVRYPLRLSGSGLKRGSAYASGMLTVSPVAATVPAIPTTDLADACAERDAGPDLVLLAIDDEDRRAVRIEQLRRSLGHVPQERVEVGDRHEPARDVEDEIQLRSGGDLLVALPTGRPATFARGAAFRRHQPSSGMCS